MAKISDNTIGDLSQILGISLAECKEFSEMRCIATAYVNKDGVELKFGADKDGIMHFRDVFIDSKGNGILMNQDFPGNGGDHTYSETKISIKPNAVERAKALLLALPSRIVTVTNDETTNSDDRNVQIPAHTNKEGRFTEEVQAAGQIFYMTPDDKGKYEQALFANRTQKPVVTVGMASTKPKVKA